MREILTSGSTRGEQVVPPGIASSPTLPKAFFHSFPSPGVGGLRHFFLFWQSAVHESNGYQIFILTTYNMYVTISGGAKDVASGWSLRFLRLVGRRFASGQAIVECSV